MLSVQSRLRKLYTALVGITGLKVFHYYASSNTKVPYLVWYEEDESSSLQAENHKAEQAIGGYCDYYTKTEFDPMFDTIQETLNSIEGLGWTYESTIYGDPTSEDNDTIHHTWSWRMY